MSSLPCSKLSLMLRIISRFSGKPPLPLVNYSSSRREVLTERTAFHNCESSCQRRAKNTSEVILGMGLSTGIFKTASHSLLSIVPANPWTSYSVSLKS